MKILVTYWTQTGNTKKVAESIFGGLPEKKVLKPFNEVDTFSGFDLVFIGFPVMQFGPPAIVREFMSTHAGGKKIALFVTHAMLSDSDDPQQKAMLEKELEKCRAICSSSELLGLFHCQGELSEKIASELFASKIPMLMQFAASRSQTLGHPDARELEQSMIFATKVHAGL